MPLRDESSLESSAPVGRTEAPLVADAAGDAVGVVALEQ